MKKKIFLKIFIISKKEKIQIQFFSSHFFFKIIKLQWIIIIFLNK